MRAVDRLVDRVDVDYVTGCWNWTGYKQQGYGRATVDGVRKMVHRFFWEDAHGQVPDGLQLDHLCRNRACCNPSHLEAVSLRENVLRGDGFYAREARKTHCPQGHAYDEANTAVYHGRRYCRTCHRAYGRETARRRRERQRG